MARRPPDPDLLTLRPEWSHRVPADAVGLAPWRLTVEAGTAERAALVRRCGLLALEALSADLECARHGAAVQVTGTLRARVVQACAVTLEPVAAELTAPVEGWFADADAAIPLARARRDRVAERAGGAYRMLEEADDPEPLGPGGTIDVGELVAQHLCLALPPYPRAPGVPEPQGAEADDPPPVGNPFAGLAAWRARGEEEA